MEGVKVEGVDDEDEDEVGEGRLSVRGRDGATMGGGLVPLGWRVCGRLGWRPS